MSTPLTTTIGNLSVLDLRGTLPSTGEYPRRDVEDLKGIVIHHSGSNINHTPQEIAEYHVYHREGRKFPGIAYHFVVEHDGKISYTQDWSAASWHAKMANQNYIGICLIGDFSIRHPSQDQLSATRDLVSNLQLAFGEWWQVFPHGAFVGTECPGDTWLAWRAKVDVPYPPSDYILAKGEDLSKRLAAIRNLTPSVEG